MSVWMNNMKESMGVYWDILLLLGGAFLGFLPALIKIIYNKVHKKQILNKVKRLGNTKDDLNIQTVCSGVPDIRPNHLMMYNKGKEFYIGFPNDLLDEALSLDPDFEVHDDTFFHDNQSFESLANQMKIPELESLINKHRLIISNHFLTRSNGCHFNRPKYGVYHMQCTERLEHDELTSVKIELFNTDYFTHRVMRSVYAELKEQGHPIANIKQGNIQQILSSYNVFTTSIGINILLLMDSAAGESVIFSRRSAGAAHTENSFKYNSTVMEGLSQTDYDSFQGRVSLDLAAKRALLEELGIQYETFHPTIRFHDLFLEKNYFEIGITASAEIDGVFEATIMDLPGKDKEMEIDKLVPIPLQQQKMNAFIQKHNFYAQGLYTLKMIAARRGITIQHDKAGRI